MFELAAVPARAAMLRVRIHKRSIPRPHADPARYKSVGMSFLRSSGSALQRMGLLFEGRPIRCAYGSQKSKYRQGIYFEVNQSLNEALGGSIEFPSSLDEFLPRCGPSVEVALGSNHSANVLGVLDNFHFAELLAQFVDTQSSSS